MNKPEPLRYNPIEESLRESVTNRYLRHYAIDILERAGIEDEVEMEGALLRAMQVCRSMNIPLEENFKMVYRNEGREVLQDFKLSDLASSLLMMNANTANVFVAKTQIELIRQFDIK